jgi:3-phenylpropionate/cinnamic acid dioxygenase small subunit
VSAITKDEAEAFLYLEAHLLDERRFEEWLDLFTADGIYWLPITDDTDAKRHVSLIHDDTQRRRERVFRLLHTEPPSQYPPSRTQHFVTNVRIENGAQDDVVVRSAQMICEMRGGDYRQLGLGDQRSFAAAAEHRLARRDGAWRIAMKKLILLNRDVQIPNLTFLL